MADFEDYEVLNILDTNRNSTCYKVKNKLTNKIFVWRAINFESYKEDTTILLDRVNTRKVLENPGLIQFYDYILHENTETIYLVTEYCKYGSLFNVIERCKKNDEYIDEDYIWNCLYKLANYLKEYGKVRLDLHEIFIDVNLDIKLLHFNLAGEETSISSALYDLGILLHYLIHFETSQKEFPEYYSNDLQNLLMFLTEKEPEIASSIEVILRHPTILLKGNFNSKKEIFIKNPKPKKEKNKGEVIETENENNINLEIMYQNKLAVLRNRENVLRVNEEKLRERSHALDRREKKVALMERIVKEKTIRAELYLKRAKEIKIKDSKKETNEKQDTSFSADCGDNSIILPTSKKLNVQEIIKPVRFTRTLSERRVRFKSHSPLKEIHNIRSKNSPIKKLHKRLETIQSDSDKASETNSEKSKKKFLLTSMFAKKPKKPNSVASSLDSVSAHTYEDLGCEELKVEDLQPINWTEESKRHAFDLLRIMNSGGSVEQIKHTFL